MNSEERQQLNEDILAPLSDSGANGRFFARLKTARRELRRKIVVTLRQISDQRKANMTEMDLLMDDWVFHNGPADTRAKQEQMLTDVAARRVAQIAAKRQLAAQAGQNASRGALDCGFERGSLTDGFDGDRGLDEF